MAANKNQHFVPRCHLKPFTLDGQGFAINLYNLDRQQLIRNAPVKNQCSRDYFYGKDSGLENAIQALESEYASVTRRIFECPARIEDKDAQFLSSFWIFQHLRTEAIQQSIIRQSIDLQNSIGEVVQDLVIGKKEATLVALSAFANRIDAIADLNLILVENRSSTPFLTSDNPAVQTNRWALLKSRKGVATFGMHSAGAIALIPLAPNLLAMLYDKDVYSVSHTDGVVFVRNCDDIRALNEHQHLNCAANLYLAPSFGAEHIGLLPDLTEQRALSGPRLDVFQKEDNKIERYYAAQGFDRTRGTEAIFAMSTYSASPTRWPSFLHWRSGGFFFANRSGVGHIRKAWIKECKGTRPFQKVLTGR